MPVSAFRALVLREGAKVPAASIDTVTEDQLPAGDVTVAVEYSGLNYKDGLAITGKGRIVRVYPMVPGIDLAGKVEQSTSPTFKPGDEVILTGWGVGESHWGGYAEKARVRAEWLVPLPAGMTPRRAMIFGTAGFTAMLCVDALETHGVDRSREVLVTGAAGGVGSVAVALLGRLGYRVTAATGRPTLTPYLKSLGAEAIIDRSELAAPCKPLLSERWGGVVDTVGGQTLATALAGVVCDGTATACGLAGGSDLPTTVMPFILRGVRLIGITSARCPMSRRLAAWRRLAELLPDGLPDEAVEEIGLAELPEKAEAILAGQVRGRVIVRPAKHSPSGKHNR
jgi:acrylyl-CoA reductase (NADPH)